MTRERKTEIASAASALLVAVLAIVVVLCSGCASAPPPIALYAEPNATDLAATRDRMTAAVRAYGCVVDDIEYGTPSGAYIPVRVTGRRRTPLEYYRNQLKAKEKTP